MAEETGAYIRLTEGEIELLLDDEDVAVEDIQNLDPHIATAITIYSCLVNDDLEFNEMLKEKFDQYGQQFLDDKGESKE